MTGSRSSSSGGISFLSLLAVLFIGLKLTGHIAWSWFWVLSPLIGGVVIVLGFIIVVFIIAMFAAYN